MTEGGAGQYSAKPTRNPLRYLLALWRSFQDLTNTDEVAIVEIGFARSRLGRRFARWEEVVARLEKDPRTAGVVRGDPFGHIDLGALAVLPEGTLGRVFAEHCRARGLNPDLVRIPGTVGARSIRKDGRPRSVSRASVRRSPASCSPR